MNENDKIGFIQTLQATSEVYRVKLEPGQVAMYWEDLKENPIEQVMEALKRCRRELQFFPKPVDIIDRLAGSTKTDAENALAIVFDCLSSGSIYRNYCFTKGGQPDKILMQTIDDMGGMLEANAQILISWKWRQNFMEKYIQNAKHPDNCRCVQTKGASPDYPVIDWETGNIKISLPGVESAELEYDNE